MSRRALARLGGVVSFGRICAGCGRRLSWGFLVRSPGSEVSTDEESSSGLACSIAIAGRRWLFVRGRPASDDSASGGDVKLERLNWNQLQEAPGQPSTSSTRSLMPGPRRAAPARRTSPTSSRCTGSTPTRAWPSSRCRSTTRPTRPPSPRPRGSSRRRRPPSPTSCSTRISATDFEKLNINAIPAVFIFGPDGKEVKRFTMDDPKNQFTYDEVEKAIVAFLTKS